MQEDNPRRRVPRTDVVLADDRVAAAAVRLGRDRVKRVVQAAQDAARAGRIAPEDVVDATVAALPRQAGSLRQVVNATGVLVHTNLGRAPLSDAAREAMTEAAGTTDVELDLATGTRGRRGRATVDALAAAVPAAGGVLVVNNNAAALALTAAALGSGGREIVISRGEMVEIGDGFRIPDLLASTGARLREVGTTNRTSERDYADALGPDTGFVLKVHPSNFVVRGFTSDVPVPVLARVARQRGVPLVVDIGSGLLQPEPLLRDEPDAASVLADGATLVTASGDKLLGGPQCGLLLGDADLVQRLRRHPLARAFRVDKLTLAALEATLDGPPSPVHTMLHADVDALWTRAERLASALVDKGVTATAVQSDATVGGGGAPEVTLPSAAVALPEAYARPLRLGDPPVVGRVERGRCLLDLRTVPERLDDALSAAVLAATDAGAR